MKKKWFIIGAIVILLVVCIVGVVLYLSTPKKNNIIAISGSELLTKLENKETFILVRTQNGCSHCKEYLPILNRILVEYDLTAYELITNNLAKESDEVKNKIDTLFNISGTPTTIFINDGEETTTFNRVIGSRSYTEMKKTLKDRGFIKE